MANRSYLTNTSEHTQQTHTHADACEKRDTGRVLGLTVPGQRSFDQLGRCIEDNLSPETLLSAATEEYKDSTTSRHEDNLAKRCLQQK